MKVMPPTSPVLVKRRLTPRKPASAVCSVDSGISISSPTASAASAFCTLWLPSIGRRNGPSGVGHDRHVDAGGPGPELLDGGGAERVGRGQQDPSAAPLFAGRQLGDGGRLAG